jgi:hypothetical protein
VATSLKSTPIQEEGDVEGEDVVFEHVGAGRDHQTSAEVKDKRKEHYKMNVRLFSSHNLSMYFQAKSLLVGRKATPEEEED